MGEPESGFVSMITMKTTASRQNPHTANAIRLSLFVFGVCGFSIAIAEEITVRLAAEDDLEHLLTLYQEPISDQANPEIECLARNIYFEARSESEQGQRAVGHVVMNRVAAKGYPNTICAVVKQGGEKRRNRCQFSWWCDGRSDQPVNKRAWRRSLELAHAILSGRSKDPTDGALWYHADYVKPVWSSALVLGKKIGHHLFYLSKKQPVYAMNSAPAL
ncbi:MAG: cell wall hydrolase [Candidatus Thiodiazotropha sp.]